MKIKVRKAKRGDLPNLWPIEVETRVEHTKFTSKKYSRLNKSRIDEKSRRNFIKVVEENLYNKNAIFLVAINKKEVIGYILAEVSTWWHSDNPPKSASIYELGVLKKYRRKGIAKQLFKELEKIAKKKGASFFKLNVWLKNKSAINFYKKHKFEDFTHEMVKKI